MKLMGIPVLSVLGGIAFGSIGSVQFWNSMTSSDPSIQQSVSRPSYSEIVPTSAGDNPEMVNDDDREMSSSRAALRKKVKQMQQGRNFLNALPDYTATIQKREVVGNELLDEQTILIKCRHHPFSVYLNWVTADPGREVLYVAGRNQGKMIAHDGGWKARIPAFSLAPDCRLAMRDARYPVTSAGFLGLVETMLSIHQQDLKDNNFASCQVETESEFEGRPCDKFILEYKSPLTSPVYRKSITWLDDEWHIPLHSEHYEWPPAGTQAADDESTLIESYTFRDVKLRVGLTDADFDRGNQEYHFR